MKIKNKNQIEETGKFQEHHIYITKDKAGKEIKREVKDGDVSGGTKDMTYKTGKKEKDRFEFVRTENPVENPSYNENGDSKEGKFKPGVKQEITYVYEKTLKSENPSKPTIPTTPSKPEEPTVPSTPDEPNVPSTPEEPTLPSTPEEPEETSPLIPLTPADPVEEVKNNDDKEVEKPEENSEETQKTEVVEQTEDVKKEVIEQVKVPNRSKIENPKTGISSSLGLISTLAASAFAYLGLDDKKRKNK